MFPGPEGPLLLLGLLDRKTAAKVRKAIAEAHPGAKATKAPIAKSTERTEKPPNKAKVKARHMK